MLARLMAAYTFVFYIIQSLNGSSLDTYVKINSAVFKDTCIFHFEKVQF